MSPLRASLSTVQTRSRAVAGVYFGGVYHGFRYAG